jgi:DNA-binding IclR family transcriptional regulator
LLILELLTRHPWGLPPREIARQLDIPVTAMQRLIVGLSESGYLHAGGKNDPIRLRTKLPALGLAYLGTSGITDLAQPILDDLAKKTGELVRLAVIESDRLTWVAKSQGARSGLLYDPGGGAEAHPATTANGQAWLSCLPADKIRELIEKHGIGHGGWDSQAPADIDKLLEQLSQARERGYSFLSDAYEPGAAAIAAPIRHVGRSEPIGTVSVAAPTIRLTAERALEIAPWLLANAQELSAAASFSPLLNGS